MPQVKVTHRHHVHVTWVLPTRVVEVTWTSLHAVLHIQHHLHLTHRPWGRVEADVKVDVFLMAATHDCLINVYLNFSNEIKDHYSSHNIFIGRPKINAEVTTKGPSLLQGLQHLDAYLGYL